MIFKQGVLREEKIKFFVGIIGVFVPYSVIISIALMCLHEIRILITFLLILFLPLFFLVLLFSLMNLEWFHIYDDRIEARYIFGIKNIVYFDNVLFVQELTINLTSRGMKKKFYVFNDGRKNNNNILDVNSCYNRKAFNLRIHKTYELENYIQNSLKLKIVS